MKEFTVYPKKQKKHSDSADFLFMLKEDGSFHQYNSAQEEIDQDKDQIDVEASWKKFKEQRRKLEKQESFKNLVKGIWDFVDGKLILAADRPEKQKAHQDTLLEGRVVATYETSLQDNPILLQDTQQNATGDYKNETDTHLSVPKGSIKVGKFFYPQKHPSFFEQPMFRPARRGSFQLRQVLGSLNTQNRDEEDVVEKFQTADFYNKTFLLTSHPLGHRRPKGNTRWSIKYNKYVEDPPNKKAAKAAEEENSRPANIRVMQVQFHANNTFSTVAGLGEAILRGKFDIVGHEKDQLYMRVSRFGFGRSVSGSVYSEGRMLSHEDSKTYWGTISYEQDETEEQTDALETAPKPTSETNDGDEKPKRLEIKGSVLFGSGLEPMPVGCFIMREAREEDMLDVDDDEDEEDDDEMDDPMPLLEDDTGMEGEGIDWSNEAGFQ